MAANTPPTVPLPQKPSIQVLPLKALIEEVTILAKQTADNQKEIVQFINDHGSTLIKRWAKKDTAKRVTLLESACPKMPKDRSVAMLDPQQKRSKSAKTGSASSSKQPVMVLSVNQDEYRVACLYPSLNQADLSKGDMLPQFLYSRTTQAPHTFAWFELENSLIDVATFQESTENDQYRMLLHEQDKASEYGKLVPCGDVANDPYVFKPSIGRQILVIQNHVYEILLAVTKKILHDSDVLGKLPKAPMTDPAIDKPDKWADVPNMVISGPYRSPEQLDLHAFEALVDAQVNVVLDHIAEMRGDPGYLVDHLRDMCQLSKGESTKTVQRFGYSAAANGRLFNESYWAALMWYRTRTVVRLITEMQANNTMYAGPKALTQPGYEAFQELEKLLLLMRALLIRNLGRSAGAWLKYDEVFGASSSTALVQGYANKKLAKEKKGVENLFFSLIEELFKPEKRELRGIETILEDVQVVIDKESDNLDSVTPFFLNLFEQLQHVHVLHKQIRLFQPFATAWHAMDSSAAEHQVKEYEIMVGKFRDHAPDFCEKTPLDPDDRELEFPLKAGAKSSEQRDAARTVQDAFWSKFDTALQTSVVAGLEDAQQAMVVEVVTEIATRTQWLRVVDREKAPKSAKGQETTSGLTSSLPSAFGGMSIGGKSGGLTEDTPKRFTPADTGKKPKRVDREPVGQVADDVAAPVEQEVQPAKEPIVVDRRAYKTLQTMFRALDVALPGKIDWNDVLHMMEQVGFTPKRAGGVLWLFERGNESITQHAPHRTAQMPIQYLLRFGRRLSRKFGWESIDDFTSQ